ncbi:DUF4862 family protein [Cryobacterium arcticum]|uniref:DUF4862 domain-containing protein n=1 Tax=Cryobacterium arcticum TaxID=670052 RepID=A0A1B1BN55_9MICO|nr:DUF4862 family protein [Cryobacterium arcticum]ANP74050.1 hypothetical protein PA27867_3116 [Cryobacterium arcticum]
MRYEPPAEPLAPRGTLVSAYAASPAHGSWDPVLEGELLRGLCALPDVVGLEIPWLGAIHPHDSAWFLHNVPAGAQLSLTALPFVMKRCREAPHYGIASRDRAGRTAALADLRRLAADVRILTEQSEAEVALVSLHTAPAGGADSAALAESLAELTDVDWNGAQLVIEHCDTVMPDHPFEKGFLPVVDEIAVAAQSGASIGMWVNWGRSAIELRSAHSVTSQIAAVADSGLLKGLTFSGASATDGPYGHAWSDAHLPVLSADPASGSLLDDVHVRAALMAAGDVEWLGVKVSRRPHDRTAADIVRTVESNLTAIRNVRTAREVKA